MSAEKEFIKKIVEGITSSTRNGDKFPFAYYNPAANGRVTWMCNFDENDKLTSAFMNTPPPGSSEKRERNVAYLKDMADAEHIQTELVKAGWKPMKPPKSTFTYKGEKVEVDNMNRAQRRAFEKNIKKAMNTDAPKSRK